MSVPEVIVSILSVVMSEMAVLWYISTLEPFTRSKYGLTQWHTGLIFMVLSTSYTVFTPVVGWLIDKGLSGLFAIILGHLFMTIGYIFMAPIPPLAQLIAVSYTHLTLPTNREV